MKHPSHIQLEQLRAALSQFKGLRPFLGVIGRVGVVVDTNILIAELHFVARGRRAANATTSLREAADAGVLQVIAPRVAIDELREQIPRLAVEWRVSEQRLRTLAAEVCKPVRFVDSVAYEGVRPSALRRVSARDPDDVPFVALAHQAAVDGIITRDGDITGTTELTVPPGVTLDLRDYSRAKAEEVSCRLGTAMIAGTAAGATYFSVRGITALARGFAKLPRPLQWTAGAAFMFVILNKRSREAVAEWIRGVVDQIGQHASIASDLVTELERLRTEAETSADSSWSAARGQLPRARKHTLIQHAYLVCVMARGGLSLEEIAAAVQLAGYRPRGPHFTRYLRQLIGDDARFVRDTNDRWTVSTIVGTRGEATRSVNDPMQPH